MKFFQDTQKILRSVTYLQTCAYSSAKFTPNYSVMHKWSPESVFYLLIKYLNIYFFKNLTNILLIIFHEQILMVGRFEKVEK